MNQSQNDEPAEVPESKGLLFGPIDFDLLKNKGATKVLFTDARLEGMLVITPCECGIETCEEDVIVVRIEHGTSNLQSTVKKAELLANESLGAFFTHSSEIQKRTTALTTTNGILSSRFKNT